MRVGRSDTNRAVTVLAPRASTPEHQRMTDIRDRMRAPTKRKVREGGADIQNAHRCLGANMSRRSNFRIVVSLVRQRRHA